MLPIFFLLNRSVLSSFTPTISPSSIVFPADGGIDTFTLSADVQTVRVEAPAPKWLMIKRASTNISLEVGVWYDLRVLKISAPINVGTAERSSSIRFTCRTADNRQGTVWVNASQVAGGDIGST